MPERLIVTALAEGDTAGVDRTELAEKVASTLREVMKKFGLSLTITVAVEDDLFGGGLQEQGDGGQRFPPMDFDGTVAPD
jgi:hypothetical protein